MADDSNSKLRLPPHSLEAEQSLLGGLLIDNEALDKVADIVSVTDFYRQDHQIIYQHIHRLIERSQPADIVTVGESLESNSELNTVGGLEYLGILAESTPTAANIRGYAQIIRERSIMRNLVEVGTDIVDNALSPQGRDAQQLLDESESKFSKLLRLVKMIVWVLLTLKNYYLR